MVRTRPVVLIVFAVVQIVFGVVGFCCGPLLFLSGAMDAFIAFQDQLPQGPQRFSQVEYWNGITERLPWFGAYMTGSNVVSAVSCGLMILGAVGMLRLRPWGWYVSLVWAILSCAFSVVGIYVMLVYIGPAIGASYEEVLSRIPPPPPGRPDMRPILEQSMKTGWLFSILPIALAVLYPAIMGALLYVPSMRRAFRPETALQQETP